MIRSTFSTTTIASSTNRPMASTMANMVSILIEKPNSPSTAKVPKMTTGTAMVGIRVARMLPINKYITKKTSTMASISVLITSSMATRDKGSGIIRIDDLHAGGEKMAHLRHFGPDRFSCLQRIGAGGLPDGQARRRACR